MADPVAADVGRAASLFRRYGSAAVFFGRLIPGVRTYISVPAGVSRMAAPAFLLWTALGSTLWTALLAYAGYRLEQHYTRVADWLDPATQAVLGGCVLAYLYRVATFRPDAAR